MSGLGLIQAANASPRSAYNESTHSGARLLTQYLTATVRGSNHPPNSSAATQQFDEDELEELELEELELLLDDELFEEDELDELLLDDELLEELERLELELELDDELLEELEKLELDELDKLELDEDDETHPSARAVHGAHDSELELLDEDGISNAPFLRSNHHRSRPAADRVGLRARRNVQVYFPNPHMRLERPRLY